VVKTTRRRRSVAKSASAPNLDPTFFFGMARGNRIQIDDVERKPYEYHWLTWACARAITRNVSRLDRFLYEKSKKEEQREHPFLELLNHPNPLMTRTTFFEAVLLNILLPSRSDAYSKANGGQCFIIPLDDMGNKVDLDKGIIPASLWPYDDSIITPWKEGGQLRGWKMKLVTGDTVKEDTYLPNQIIRISQFNPYDWLKGIPITSPVGMAFISDLKAEIWNERNYDNDAVPAGTLSSKEFLNDATVNELQKRWYEKYGGPGNVRRIAVLGAGLEFKQLQMNAKDLEFQKSRDNVRKTFLAATGLNEIALGNYEQINYATIVEGRRMLWEDTYIPFDDLINESMTSQCVRYIDRPRASWILKSDISAVPAMRRDMKEPIANAKVLYDMGAPFSLACEMNAIQLPKDTLTKFPWLNEEPKKASPFGGIGEGVSPAVEPTKSLVRITRSHISKVSESYIERVLSPGERFFIKKLESFFNGQRNEAQDIVDAWMKTAANPLIDASAFTLPLGPWTDKLVTIYRSVAYDQLHRELQKLSEEVGSISFNVINPMIDRFVGRRLYDLRGVNRTTNEYIMNHVKEAIDTGIRDNLTIREMGKGIKEALSDVGEIRKNHSLTIARTETSIISGSARYEAFQTAGIEYHQWTTAEDERVRDTHADENGNVVKVGDRFPVTNLLYPAQMGGPAGEVINCRCVALAVEGDQDNG
jgi:SPP1 gp7 family putative phage head morphogenesis protein